MTLYNKLKFYSDCIEVINTNNNKDVSVYFKFSEIHEESHITLDKSFVIINYMNGKYLSKIYLKNAKKEYDKLIKIYKKWLGKEKKNTHNDYFIPIKKHRYWCVTYQRSGCTLKSDYFVGSKLSIFDFLKIDGYHIINCDEIGKPKKFRNLEKE